MNAEIGDLRMANTGSGWHVERLCPMNTSDPSPDNAFWQQVSRNYMREGNARKVWSRMLNERLLRKTGI